MKAEEFVLTDNIELVVAKITKLNKKADKLLCPRITVTVTDETKIEVLKKNAEAGRLQDETYHYTKIIIEGETPKLNGWSLVAVKHHDPDMGLMIDTVPEKEMPKEFRETGDACDHCGHNRRRNETFILEKELKELSEDEKLRYL